MMMSMVNGPVEISTAKPVGKIEIPVEKREPNNRIRTAPIKLNL